MLIMKHITLLTLFAILAVGTAGIITAVKNIPATEAKQVICAENGDETVSESVCQNKKTGENTHTICDLRFGSCYPATTTFDKQEAKDISKSLKAECKQSPDIFTCEKSNP